eukprot:GFUD01052086.1.p1 GENE.GFUD01052086.1~~GFUD01052086.1.p1  ORF type:complete len:115 (-),score=18.39 GFUD01052086.1:26-370(-)
MILKTEELITNKTDIIETAVKNSKVDPFHTLLSTAAIAGGSLIIVCCLSVFCLCVCWSQQRRKVGKHSLVGGCSTYSGSSGSVSSVESLYSQDLSGSYDTISEDRFLSSLEDEV